MFGSDMVDTKMNASGDHKSSLLPYLQVDDKGENTYDAQTPVAWQTEDTDIDFIKEHAQNYMIPDGPYAGMILWDVLTGGGAVNPEDLGSTWANNKLLFGQRAHLVAEEPVKKIERDDYAALAVAAPAAAPVYPDSGSSGGGGWSGGGSGGYAPNIYSHPAYSLNPDKAASLYTKSPSYARFDYLRPSVETKGSREAYRREDF
jgi:hypothetical protein